MTSRGGGGRRGLEAAMRGLRTPLGGVLAAALLVRVTSFIWGMPGSDGWDDDGVAPRDFLVAVLESFWPGHHATYPPLHMLLLTALTAPVWIATAWLAPSRDPGALVHAFIQVGPMTAMALIARAVTVAMSLGILWNLAKVGERLRGSARAGSWVAAACAVNAVLTYYSQTTNLDVPYLFWGVLGMRWLVDAVAGRQPALLRRVLVAAALAVTTKDQAYALFLLGVPLTLGAWILADGWARARVRALVRELALGTAIALAVLLVVDGALVNPTGFADRLRTLLGANSQDHAFYTKDWSGRVGTLLDCARDFGRYYPLAFAPLAAYGLFIAASRGDEARRAAGWIPFFFALSFTLAFNVPAGRTEHRFVLPQSLVWGLYAGMACDALHERYGVRRRVSFWVAAALVFAPAAFGAAAVDAAMLLDPRYDAEAWMRDHVRPGETLELYGNDVHLPRLPPQAHMWRVDVTPLAGRNPLPEVAEIEAPFWGVESRKPELIVASAFWMDNYLLDPGEHALPGHVLTARQRAFARETETRDYFRALQAGELGYRLVHRSVFDSRVWPRVDIHESLTREIWIFERTADADQRDGT
jgi:hypothetical protein